MLGVTRIRHDEAAGRELLREYVFGGMYGPSRVPRGIDPALVSEYVEAEIQPGSWTNAYGKALDVIRFYERGDVLGHLMQALTRNELDAGSIRRSAYVLQAMGDLGTPHDARAAGGYLDGVLVPLPAAIDATRDLFDAHVTLAPDHTLDALADRIRAAVDAARLTEQESEEKMVAYDKVDAIQRNDLPRARGVAATKVAVDALPEGPRRDELVRVYMGQSTAVGALIETWAARALRREALTGDPAPVWAAFGRAIDAAEKAPLPKAHVDFAVLRAAQAILYLGGQLSDHHAELYAKAEGGAANFLWDDP